MKNIQRTLIGGVAVAVARFIATGLPLAAAGRDEDGHGSKKDDKKRKKGKDNKKAKKGKGRRDDDARG